MAQISFSDAFFAAQKTFKDEIFCKDWSKLITSLRALMGDTGLDVGHASSLDDLRKHVAQSKVSLTSRASDEGAGCLFGTGDYDLDKGKLTAAAAAKSNAAATINEKAAALKYLRHIYLLKKFGSHKVWICSLPNSYGKWPDEEMDGIGLAPLRTKLADVSERFTLDDKKHLSDATQLGLRWCKKTLILLADAKKGKNRDTIKRWFADENATETEIDGMIATLTSGFKKMVTVIKSNGLVLTDNPVYRGKTEEQSEAFVFAPRERLDVVYVESAFFGNNNLLKGLDNWTRILVHELSHREATTVDVPGKYAWGGIKPNSADFPSAKAITNADSWAWFCADAAGALTEGQRSSALQ